MSSTTSTAAAASVEWIMCQGLGTTPSSPTPRSTIGHVWSNCEETLDCIEAGVMATSSSNDAEALLTWFLEAGHEKSIPSARIGALHLLIAALPRCRPPVLSNAYERLTQLLRSCMTGASSSSPIRQLACQATVALIRRGYSMTSTDDGGSNKPSTSSSSEGRQQIQEGVRLLVAAILTGAGPEEKDIKVQAVALSSLASSAGVVGTALKSFAPKIEGVAYAALDAADPGVRKAAAACLATVPLMLSDGPTWTSIMMSLVKEAATTLKQVWPEANVASECQKGSSHKPALCPMPPTPTGTAADGGNKGKKKKKGGGGGGQGDIKAYGLQARRRIEGSVEGVIALLDAGFLSGSVILPSPALLGLCEVFMTISPKGTSPLGSTPSALPSTALCALQPLLRSLGLRLLNALLSASRTSCIRHLSRLARLVLRCLSWPASQGLRARAYDLLSRLVLFTGAALTAKVVDPAIPLLTHHASTLLFSSPTTSPMDGLLSGTATSTLRYTSGKSGGLKRAKPGADLLKLPAGQEAAQVAPTLIDDDQTACAVLKALETIILGCGPALAAGSRLLIDRLVGVGIADLSKGVPRLAGRGSTGGIAEQQQQPAGVSRLRTNGSIRASFLELTTRTLLVPRQDGAGSGLVPLAAKVFGILVLDPCEAVARAALLGRSVAESITHPRACPVFIPSSLLQIADAKAGSSSGHVSSSNPYSASQVSELMVGKTMIPSATVASSSSREEKETIPVVTLTSMAAAKESVSIKVADVWATGEAGGGGRGKEATVTAKRHKQDYQDQPAATVSSDISNKKAKVEQKVPTTTAKEDAGKGGGQQANKKWELKGTTTSSSLQPESKKAKPDLTTAVRGKASAVPSSKAVPPPPTTTAITVKPSAIEPTKKASHVVSGKGQILQNKEEEEEEEEPFPEIVGDDDSSSEE